jgi:phosphoribosylglycinamide formyltransferase-1
VSDARPVNIGVLASHTGTNLQAIMDACKRGALPARVTVVISNNSQSGAIARAAAADIPTCHLSGKTHHWDGALDVAVAETLATHDVQIVVTAGYMKKVGPVTRKRFPVIINTHPALLPKHGGQGMYGMHVHRAVIEGGDSETGITVHYVTAEYDTGPTIAQLPIPVLAHDTPETLAARMLPLEHELLVTCISKVIDTAAPR